MNHTEPSSSTRILTVALNVYSVKLPTIESEYPFSLSSQTGTLLSLLSRACRCSLHAAGTAADFLSSKSRLIRSIFLRIRSIFKAIGWPFGILTWDSGLNSNVLGHSCRRQKQKGWDLRASSSVHFALFSSLLKRYLLTRTALKIYERELWSDSSCYI